MIKKKVDKTFLFTVIILIVTGFFLFFSAAMSLLTKSTAQFQNIFISQGISLIIGFVVMYIFSIIHYKVWQKYSLFIFLGGIIVTLLVFIPGLGMMHVDSARWINLGLFTFQPVEILKMAFVIYLAALFAKNEEKIEKPIYGIIPLAIVIGVSGLILLNQPDTNNFIILAITGLIIFIIAGGKWRDSFIVGTLGVLSAGYLAMTRPYIWERIKTFYQVFFSPESLDRAGSAYQIDQSLIAVSGGEWLGRGLGQSVQKLTFLPEAVGDSIFAVVAEELGFIGSSIIIFIIIFLIYRGLLIAKRAPDTFSRLLVVGIVILIAVQSFTNIAGMLNLFPVSGVPLTFFSHGGTSLIAAMASVGIILNVSRYKINKK